MLRYDEELRLRRQLTGAQLTLKLEAPINIVRATVEGLKQLKRAEEVAALRGISVSDLA